MWITNELLEPNARSKQPDRDDASRFPEQLCDVRIAVVVYVAQDQHLSGVRIQLRYCGVKPPVKLLQRVRLTGIGRGFETIPVLGEDMPLPQPDRIQRRVH